MRAEERKRIEARLDAKFEDVVRTRLAVRRSDGAMGGSELAHLDNHPADLGTELHDSELDETTGIFLDEEERRIAEARRALERGTYGVCVNCGAAIPPERLLAVPEAVRCMNCQRLFEGAHRQRR